MRLEIKTPAKAGVVVWFERRLIGGPEFFHNVIAGLHAGTVDVTVVYLSLIHI